MTVMAEQQLDPSLIRQLEQQARILSERYHAALEEMCERSLVDPRARGVLVVRSEEGWTMTLSDDVPFGQIHERLDAGGVTYGG